MCDEIRQQRREQPGRLFPCLMDGGVNITVLRHEVLRLHLRPAGEAQPRFREIPLGIKSYRRRRPPPLFRHIRLALRQLCHQKRHTPRRPYRPDIAIRKTQLRQRFRGVFFQLRQNARHGVGRNLLRPDL